jgi:hypothetical protein
VMLGATRNGISSDDRNSSSHSKTFRAAMGFSFHSTGCVKRAKGCWNESHTINGSSPAAKTKEKPAGLNRCLTSHPPEVNRGPPQLAAPVIRPLPPEFLHWIG